MNSTADPSTQTVAAAPKGDTEKGFFDDLAGCWRALPDKGLFFSLLAVWLALFQFLGNSVFGYVDTRSLMHWMYNSYNALYSEDGHGNLIPFVVIGLFYWKRHELLARPLRNWWPALILVVGALLMHIVAYVIQQPLISIMAFFIGLYGLTGLVWGPAWLRESAFPFLLFAFMVPLGANADIITFPLRLWVTQIVALISNGILGLDIIQTGTELVDSQRSFHYEVAPACSGIRSLVAIVAMATIYAFVAFKRWWKRGIMMFSAFPLAVASNVFRMMFIVITAEAFGQQAGNYVHESQIFSLLPYVPGIIGLFVLERFLKSDAKPSGQPAATPGATP